MNKQFLRFYDSMIIDMYLREAEWFWNIKVVLRETKINETSMWMIKLRISVCFIVLYMNIDVAYDVTNKIPKNLKTFKYI